MRHSTRLPALPKNWEKMLISADQDAEPLLGKLGRRDVLAGGVVAP
jgi:hypothetical protein